MWGMSRGGIEMRTEQEVWLRLRLLLKEHKWKKKETDELEWVLYIGAENEFNEFGKRIGGMQDEISIREGIENKELRDWLLEESK